MKKTYRKELRLSSADNHRLKQLCYNCDTNNESDVLRFCLRLTYELMEAHENGSWEYETGRLAHERINAYEGYGVNIIEDDYFS